jgi:hypothetical protein
LRSPPFGEGGMCDLNIIQIPPKGEASMNIKGIQVTALQSTTTSENLALHPPHLMPQPLDFYSILTLDIINVGRYY